MKILVNYADEKYKKTQRVNSWTGRHIAGFDKVVEFGPQDIDESYRNFHMDIFSYTRGNGLWLWKPYLINRLLNECNDGDIVFYADSGCFFLKKIDSIIESLESGESIWVSDIPLLENCFTKSGCFIKMQCNSDEIRYSNQIQGTFFMAINNEESRKFVAEWLHYCEDIELLAPEGELKTSINVGKEFLVHREDQSILSLLCKKHGIIAHKDPSQRGIFQASYYSPNYAFFPTKHDDHYRNIILLHKTPDVSIFKIVKMLIKTASASLKMKG